jgi:hypothetical protein
MDVFERLVCLPRNRNGLSRREKLLFKRAMALFQSKSPFWPSGEKPSYRSMDDFRSLVSFACREKSCRGRRKVLFGRAMALCQNRISFLLS